MFLNFSIKISRKITEKCSNEIRFFFRNSDPKRYQILGRPSAGPHKIRTVNGVLPFGKARKCIGRQVFVNPLGVGLDFLINVGIKSGS